MVLSQNIDLICGNQHLIPSFCTFEHSSFNSLNQSILNLEILISSIWVAYLCSWSALIIYQLWILDSHISNFLNLSCILSFIDWFVWELQCLLHCPKKATCDNIHPQWNYTREEGEYAVIYRPLRASDRRSGRLRQEPQMLDFLEHFEVG